MGGTTYRNIPNLAPDWPGLSKMVVGHTQPQPKAPQETPQTVIQPEAQGGSAGEVRGRQKGTKASTEKDGALRK